MYLHVSWEALLLPICICVQPCNPVVMCLTLMTPMQMYHPVLGMTLHMCVE